jgi:hypothetical protein
VKEEALAHGGEGGCRARKKKDPITACKKKFCELVEKRKEKANRNTVINHVPDFLKKLIFGRPKRKYNDQMRFELEGGRI